jgi:small subunit ribosomal protein S1
VIIGDKVEGVVKNITDFGAFVDLGGIDGLLHITDLSWGRVNHPSEVVAIGQEIEVKVLDFEQERERISLGLKQLQSYPWETWKTGTRSRPSSRGKRGEHRANYGAFVELEKGVEGLIHISEMSWTKRHHQAPVEGRLDRRRGRRDGAEDRQGEREDQPGPQAVRERIPG